MNNTSVNWTSFSRRRKGILGCLGLLFACGICTVTWSLTPGGKQAIREANVTATARSISSAATSEAHKQAVEIALTQTADHPNPAGLATEAQPKPATPTANSETPLREPTRVPITSSIPESTATAIPTVSSLQPTQIATVVGDADSIVKSSKIIDSNGQQVESMLGKPVESLDLGIGSAEEVPDGGVSRSYKTGKYEIWVNFDKKGIAKGLQIDDGLLDDSYSLDQWPIIFRRIGVDFAGFPDIVAPAARRWTNTSGYSIMVAAEEIGGKVWTVRIYKIP